MVRIIIFVIIAVCCPIHVMGQQLPYYEHKEVVYRNEYYISPSKYDYSEFTRTVVADSESKYEQAQKIFLWVCNNISFDPTLSIRTADMAWDSKRAVCQGYCELFYRMAETINLKTRLVYGMVKHPTKPDELEHHVWLRVFTEKGPILLDPTWGSGRFVNGNYVHYPNPMMWFDVPQELFDETHIVKKKKKMF